MVRELSDNDFQDVVLKSDVPVFVDFWAPWCGPCKMISPFIEKLSNVYADNIEFCKVNVDQAPEIAQFYGITSIPTLMIFDKGWKVDQIVGAMPESTIESMLSEVL